MTLDITVSQPLLINGQQLKVEYSSDGVNYTLDSYQTSNSFTTTYSGFVAGNTYYFRFTLVKSTSPVIECESVVKQITIPEEITCLEFTGTLEKGNENQWYLNIEYTTPSPYVAPCSLIIKYGTSYPLQTITYSTLPASPIIIPASNQTYYVEIYGVDCDGNQTLCDELTITPTIGECTHAVITDADIIQSNGNYFLQIQLTPSSPATGSYYVNFFQANSFTTGIADSGSTVFWATGANPETITIQVFPNLNIIESDIVYNGGISDDCGYLSKFDASITIR